MSRLARTLTITVATVATTLATMLAIELVIRLREGPGHSIRLQDLVESPFVEIGTVVGVVIGAPLALGLLWPTDLRRSMPLVTLAIFVSALSTVPLTDRLLGAFGGLLAGVAALLWCNGRATGGARSALDAPGRGAENARPSIP